MTSSPTRPQCFLGVQVISQAIRVCQDESFLSPLENWASIECLRQLCNHQPRTAARRLAYGLWRWSPNRTQLESRHARHSIFIRRQQRRQRTVEAETLLDSTTTTINCRRQLRVESSNCVWVQFKQRATADTSTSKVQTAPSSVFEQQQHATASSSTLQFSNVWYSASNDNKQGSTADSTPPADPTAR